jgi:hypothetical protein
LDPINCWLTWALPFLKASKISSQQTRQEKLVLPRFNPFFRPSSRHLGHIHSWNFIVRLLHIFFVPHQFGLFSHGWDEGFPCSGTRTLVSFAEKLLGQLRIAKLVTPPPLRVSTIHRQYKEGKARQSHWADGDQDHQRPLSSSKKSPCQQPPPMV